MNLPEVTYLVLKELRFELRSLWLQRFQALGTVDSWYSCLSGLVPSGRGECSGVCSRATQRLQCIGNIFQAFSVFSHEFLLCLKPASPGPRCEAQRSKLSVRGHMSIFNTEHRVRSKKCTCRFQSWNILSNKPLFVCVILKCREGKRKGLYISSLMDSRQGPGRREDTHMKGLGIDCSSRSSNLY